MRQHSYKRSDRLGNQLHREIIKVIQYDVNDPRLEFVTITEVRLSDNMKDATVFVYGSMKPDSDWRLRPVYITEMKKNGRWTNPKIAPFSKYGPYNFTVGPDDQILYFTTLKSPDKTTHMFGEQANIWAVKLEMDGWTEPVMMGRSINTERYYENYPSVTVDGTIYYMSRREVGAGRTDVWRSQNLDGWNLMTMVRGLRNSLSQT